MNLNIFETILIVLFTALIVSVIFRQLKISIVLGYLVVGALMGPHVLGLIPDEQKIHEIAQFGIVFLMFNVGLEFSVPQLFSLRFPVFIIGGLQVLLCIVLTVLIGWLFQIPLLAALVIGGIVAMSSTAIVVKQLHEQLELQSHHGLDAIGVLLFQDLAVIPFMILIAGLTHAGERSLTFILFIALIKGLIAIGVIFFVGRVVLKPLFRIIAKTRAVELFTLTVLLVTLSAAWMTQVLGLSFALGAFLAGIMLAETEFRHQIEVEIRPFRDILLGLFFISIGMLAFIGDWYADVPWILLLFLILVLGKLVLVTLISYLSGRRYETALRTGLILAQGGEFGFAILTLALSKNILSARYEQIVLAALLLSLAVAPLLIRYNKKIASFFAGRRYQPEDETIEKNILHVARELNNHIIICGYGRVGQQIARILDKVHIPYLGLDLDAERIKQLQLAGDNVIYGDASHPGILKAAGLRHSKAVVICLNDFHADIKALNLIRAHHATLPVIARCKDESELEELKKHQATHVIAEIFEGSLMIAHLLLELLQIPSRNISHIMQEARSENYDLLRKVFISNEEESLTLPHEQLLPIIIPEDAYANGLYLNEIPLKEIGISVISIRRGKEKILNPEGTMKILANDIVVLHGFPEKLEEAERILLEG